MECKENIIGSASVAGGLGHYLSRTPATAENEVTRKDHDGTLYPTNDPTSTDPVTTLPEVKITAPKNSIR